MGKGKGIEFVGMTLANAADGALEAQFQDKLAEVVAVAADLSRFEQSKGVTRCSIKMECVFYLHNSGSADVGAKSQLVQPKTKESVHGAKIRDGVILVEDSEQLEMGDTLEAPRERVRSLRKAAATKGKGDTQE